MRQGQNPLRNAHVNWPKLVFAVVTHLPSMEGYHASRFQIVRESLRSMVANSGERDPFVLIWDNDSCVDFKKWVRREYKPDMLVESTNLGKIGARTAILKMLPPETIVAFADDDIYYYPGWLEPQLDILNHFPNVGAVTGYPVRTSFRWGCKNTIEWSEREGRIVEVGRFLPDEWEHDFAVSLGRDPQWHRDVYTPNDYDYRVTYRGKQAYCTSHHCQFVAYAGRLAPLGVYDGKAMGDERWFDTAIDEAGLLRLATTQRLTRHMGNVMDAKLQADIDAAEGRTLHPEQARVYRARQDGYYYEVAEGIYT